MSVLAENSERLVHEKGMTIKSLARLSGIPATTLYAVKRRNQNKMNTQIATQICKTLGVGIEDLFKECTTEETEDEMIVNEIAPPTIDKTTFVNGLSEALKWDPRSKVMDIKYFERFGGHPFEVVKINFIDGTDKKIQVTGYNCGTIYKEVGAAVYGPGALRELTDEDIKSMT